MIWILNENFRKIKLLRKYSLAQFVDKTKEVGTFSISAVYADENLYLLDRTKVYYVLYNQENCDYDLLGKVEKVSKENEEDADYPDIIKVEGRLSTFLLTKRVLNGTINFKGDTIEYFKTLIKKCFDTENNKSDRFIKLDILEQIDSNIYTGVEIDKQVTGGTLYDEIQPLLEQNRLCIDIIPVVENRHDLSEIYSNLSGKTNISKFKVVIKTGIDRRRGNKNKLKPVILSKSLSNIKRTSYEYNSETDTNVAYVAGEGEEEDRKWYEIQKEEGNRKSAWQREELWIDARDIQSTQDNGSTITSEEYDKLIKERTNEKFEENTISEKYESTANTLDKRFVYGKDYNKCDWITIVDSDLGIEIDAQITTVTTSVQNNSTIIDLEFEYGKITKNEVNNLKQINSNFEETQNDVKYLSNKIKKMFKPELFEPVVLLQTNYITTTQAVSYDCEWLKYRYLLVRFGNYGNWYQTVLIPTSEFKTTTYLRRIQIYHVDGFIVNVYQNGNNKVIVQANRTTGNFTISVYGIIKIE